MMPLSDAWRQRMLYASEQAGVCWRTPRPQKPLSKIHILLI
jgi:hypothetical protein